MKSFYSMVLFILAEWMCVQISKISLIITIKNYVIFSMLFINTLLTKTFSYANKQLTLLPKCFDMNTLWNFEIIHGKVNNIDSFDHNFVLMEIRPKVYLVAINLICKIILVVPDWKALSVLFSRKSIVIE